MQILWALVFLAVMAISCIWAWRRTRAALMFRSIPSHCVGAVAGVFAAVVALVRRLRC